MAQHGHSEACCKTPIANHDYTEKGSWVEVDGLKTYKTGNEDATSAIFILYDIMGFSPQLLQGCDILATHGKTPYQVFVPDMLDGHYAKKEWFASDTEEMKKIKMEFFGGPAAPAKAVARLPSVVKQITEMSGGKIEKWASVGYCWGGKVVSLTSGEDSPFTAVAEVHPGLLDAKDAATVTKPLCMLASGGENADDVKSFAAALKVPNHVETFQDQVHGWMAARGDLKNERNKAEYERGYHTLLEFFAKYL